MKNQMLKVMLAAAALAAMGCGGSSAPAEETAAAEPTTGSEATAEAAPAGEPAAAEAKADEAKAPAAEAPQTPKFSVSIVHKVKDYDAWKAAYDTHQQARKDAGFTAESLSDVTGKKNTVAIWLPFNDLAKAEAFAASDDLKAKMKEAGVVGKPEVYFMSHVDMYMPPPAEGQPMPMLPALMARQEVKDFAAFKAAWDAAKESWKGSLAAWALSQGAKAEEANVAYLYFNGTDAKALKAWWTSKENKKWLKDAGAKGAAKTYETMEKSFTMYQ